MTKEKLSNRAGQQLRIRLAVYVLGAQVRRFAVTLFPKMGKSKR